MHFMDTTTNKTAKRRSKTKRYECQNPTKPRGIFNAARKA